MNTDLHVLSVVRNEADRYWRSALEAWSQFADSIVVLDDDSDDETMEIAREFEDVVEVEPNFEVDGSMWGHETPYRRALFEFAWTNASEGDVLFWLDADMAPIHDPREFFEQADIQRWAFYLYDLWSTDEMHMLGQYGRERFVYRDEPPYWRAHESPRTWAIRVTDESVEDFDWEGRGIHSGHLPAGYLFKDRPTCIVPKSDGLSHWGYFDPEDQQKKYRRYMEVSEQLSEFEYRHAESIISEAPMLRPLYEDLDYVLEKP